jgi:dipeptidase
MDGGTVHRPGRKDGDPEGWSVCMHPEPATGATAASLVVELPPPGAGPATAWCGLATPCTGVFLPVPVGAELPAPLRTGTGEPDPASAWWAMKALGDAVQRDPAARTPAVQEAWTAWERRMLAEVAAGGPGGDRALRERVEELSRRQRELLARLTAEPAREESVS